MRSADRRRRREFLQIVRRAGNSFPAAATVSWVQPNAGARAKHRSGRRPDLSGQAVAGDLVVLRRNVGVKCGTAARPSDLDHMRRQCGLLRRASRRVLPDPPQLQVAVLPADRQSSEPLHVRSRPRHRDSHCKQRGASRALNGCRAARPRDSSLRPLPSPSGQRPYARPPPQSSNALKVLPFRPYSRRPIVRVVQRYFGLEVGHSVSPPGR